jgi:hypothetical protein
MLNAHQAPCTASYGMLCCGGFHDFGYSWMRGADGSKHREDVLFMDLDWVQSAPLTACIQLNLNHLIKIEQLKFNIKILNILKYQYCI